MRVASLGQVVAGSKVLAIIVVSMWLTASIFYFGYHKSIVESAYEGRSISILNRAIAHHRAQSESRNLEYYQNKSTTAFVELSLGVGLTEGVLLVVAFRHRWVKRAIRAGKKFFLKPEGAFNLALFRLIFFCFFAWYATASPSRVDGNTIVWFYRLPHELQIAPFGFGWALPCIAAIPPSAIKAFAGLLPIVCLAAAIGCFARFSAFLAALLGFVLLGIPQSFGKIEHTHTLVWVASLLAASRSADTLSVDALVGAASGSSKEAMSRSSAYGLPLRLIWIILGIGYLSAGMWKAIDGRWEWIFSDNLRNHVFSRAFLNNTTPSLAMNLPTWFFQFAAFFVIAFQLSFIVLILFRSGRVIAVLLGLLFHNSIGLFFGTASFLPVQVCYCSFIDWQSAIQWWRRRFARPSYVRYDNGCIVCRRVVGCAATLGWPNAFPYNDTPLDLHMPRAASVTAGTAIDLHVNHSAAPTVHTYFLACNSLSKQVPLIWLAYPILLGSHIFETLHVPATNAVVSGADRFFGRPAPHALFAAKNVGNQVYFVGLVGAVIILTNAVFAILHIHGWPFTCFPSFHHIERGRMMLFRIEKIDEAGNTASLDSISALKTLNRFRVQAICDNIYRNPEKPEIGTAFCKVLRESMPACNRRFPIRIYAEEDSILPWNKKKNPLSRSLVFECK